MKRPRLTYANVVATLALFLAVGGSAAFAASKIQSSDIAAGAVKTSGLHKRAVTSGKLATGAVRSNQIADGAVSAPQIATGAVSGKQVAAGSLSSTQIAPASIQPSSLEVPLEFAAKPTGGAIAIPSNGGEEVNYPLSNVAWTQRPGQVVVIFGGGTTSLAYDGSGSGSCQVGIGVFINGKQVGGGGFSTASETLETGEQNYGAGTEIDPLQATTRTLVVKVQSNGDCTPDSRIDSSRFRVIGFG
ncbi:MAG TPA: hypothetical protein VGG40_00985 [Solirubrobacterales bacterium]|jgi:hypothetical protein